MPTYKSISPEEADALWQCNVDSLEYKFSGVTVNGVYVEWSKYDNMHTICHKPSDVDWALDWRVRTDE